MWLRGALQHHGPPSEPQEICPDAFAQKQVVGYVFELDKAYETTWQCAIIWDVHRIGLRGPLHVFVAEYLRGRRIRVRIGTTLSDELYPENGVLTGAVLAVACCGLKINELSSRIAKDIFRALFIGDLAIHFRSRSQDTFAAGSKCYTGMGYLE